MPMESKASQVPLKVERWIAEVRGGSRAALDPLLVACSPYLLTIANRMLCTALRSRLDPVDVVQDTLMKAWQHFSEFRGETQADWLAWLRQILRRNLANESRDHIHRARRSIRREVPLAQAAEMPQPVEAGSESESPAGQAQAKERLAVLEDSLRRLPRRYRDVLRLRSKEELTFAQIGERLHCSADAARKLWSRAVAKLTLLLGEDSKA